MSSHPETTPPYCSASDSGYLFHFSKLCVILFVLQKTGGGDMDIRTERLRAAFDASGLTQTELCKKTGINKGALSSYLSGRYFPKQKAIEALSDILGVSVFYLMGLNVPADSSDHLSSELTTDEAYLLELFRSLNPVGKRKAVESIEDLTQIEKYIKIQDRSSAEVG